MVQNCCVVNCSNRQIKNTPFSFHSFPWSDRHRLAAWISRISRKNPDGSEWCPKPCDKVCSSHFVKADFFKAHNRSKPCDKVCSSHFVKADFFKAHNRSILKTDAIPSVFPNYPKHKQVYSSRRKSPKRRVLVSPPTKSQPRPAISPSASIQLDHAYTFSSVEAHLQSTQRKLDFYLEKQQKQASELKKMKKQVQRRDKKIESLSGH
ncbi:hypothetical protein EGW08_022762 [Elysia chlorotica]|uniref:THAP-type domain-containing protein n=1 Tax=Elysia chlorotica TaxID=188477 RepID=A0A3S0Z8U9_ELYCH|nr:hypothetical protein EGW08_022762 [Elysia chlorotica]